ncbi:hypothetical protein HKX48_009354, partial [Thoreauomyces humboldtii]
MSLITITHPGGLKVTHEQIGGRGVPILQDEATGSLYFLLKETCSALNVSYGKARGVSHRQKLLGVVLSGTELKEFKARAAFSTTASHLAFVEGAGLKGLLVHCGLPEEEIPDIIKLATTAPPDLDKERASLEGEAHLRQPEAVLLQR